MALWSGVSASDSRAPQSAVAPVRPTLAPAAVLARRLSAGGRTARGSLAVERRPVRCGPTVRAARRWRTSASPSTSTSTSGQPKPKPKPKSKPKPKPKPIKPNTNTNPIHLRGECWLKQQRGKATRPKDPFTNHTFFPAAMRAAERKRWPFAVPSRIWSGPVPERIPWTSGVLAPADELVSSAPPNDRWWERWCARHGPCEPT